MPAAKRSRRTPDSGLPRPPAALAERIGHTFRDEALLRQALTHPSCVGEGGETPPPHNQRLEFLGDSVLGLILSEALFARFPALREGDLSRYRASLVRGGLLSDLARDLRLGDHLHLGRGESETGGRDRDSVLEDAFEALVGALYLDAGFDATRRLVLRWYGDLGKRIREIEDTENPKGRLQERIQALEGDLTPEYRILAEEGPSHNRRFEVEVRLGNTALARGQGASKKQAESRAAANALRNWERMFVTRDW